MPPQFLTPKTSAVRSPTNWLRPNWPSAAAVPTRVLLAAIAHLWETSPQANATVLNSTGNPAKAPVKLGNGVHT
jgi:hypothetical protein